MDSLGQLPSQKPRARMAHLAAGRLSLRTEIGRPIAAILLERRVAAIHALAPRVGLVHARRVGIAIDAVALAAPVPEARQAARSLGRKREVGLPIGAIAGELCRLATNALGPLV